MAFSQVATSRSLHFAKISLHSPNLQGETGSMGAASTTTQCVRRRMATRSSWPFRFTDDYVASPVLATSFTSRLSRRTLKRLQTTSGDHHRTGRLRASPELPNLSEPRGRGECCCRTG